MVVADLDIHYKSEGSNDSSYIVIRIRISANPGIKHTRIKMGRVPRVEKAPCRYQTGNTIFGMWTPSSENFPQKRPNVLKQEVKSFLMMRIIDHAKPDGAGISSQFSICQVKTRR